MALNTIVTRYELSKIFSPTDLTSWESAAKDAPQSIASRMVLNLTSSLENFLYRPGQDRMFDRGVLESTPDQPTALLQGFLAERAEEVGEFELLEAGGFGAKLDSFAFNVDNKLSWIKELSSVLVNREEKIPYNEVRDRFGWFGSFFNYWRMIRPHPWLDDASTDEVPNRFRVAILGDWATGMYGAPISAKSIHNDPAGFNAVIHLGDIYYAGAEKEVKNSFLPFWPRPQGAYLRALNANHEMLTGGHGYFNFVLPSFKQTASFFAFVNDYWILAGLDTAYAAKWNVFSDGKLTADQVSWLKYLVKLHKDKKLILFSHHYPFSLVGWHGRRKSLKPQKSVLFRQLNDFLREDKIFAWYWGHEHRCLLYEKDMRGGYYGRCVGHGGFPYDRDRSTYVTSSPARSIAGGVSWRLLTGHSLMPDGLLLDGPNPYVPTAPDDFGTQGYMSIELDDMHINEVVHLPDSNVVYSKLLI
ncbi:MAG TPA: metallophosphoesterase [Pyrinomonadaceae bacterium]|nr:metallophosphoesterase [Pyrinomonadaceae bacterium]